MLMAEIAVGVFIALLAFHFFKKYNERNAEIILKKQEMDIYSKKLVQEMDARIQESFIRYLAVFHDQLLTLEDDKTITYQDAGLIEFRLFMEHCEKLSANLALEEENNNNLLEISDIHKQHIKNEISSIIRIKSITAQQGALRMMEDKLVEIAK